MERNKRSGDIAATKSYINSEEKHKVRLVTFVRKELISIWANWPLLQVKWFGRVDFTSGEVTSTSGELVPGELNFGRFDLIPFDRELFEHKQW